MKTLNTNSLNIQKSNNPFIIENIFIYKLFSNNYVTEVISNSSVKLHGDLTDEISVGDFVLFPLINFSHDNEVFSISYNSGTNETTLSVVTALVTSDFLGTYVSLKIDITDKLLKYGVKDIVQKIEGVVLNNFDSGKLDFEVDNSDGYFSNKQQTGLIDLSDIFYVKYLIKFKASSEPDAIYFGGILSLIDSQPDYYNKSYIFRVLGHSKELERYASWNVSNYDENTFNKISGIQVIEYTPSENSQEGVKRIKYLPFSNSRLKGVRVDSVSKDTEVGIKILEFRWPYYFRWDNGDWTKVAVIGDTTSGIKRLYAKNGSGTTRYADVIFGAGDALNEYPDDDAEDWVDIKNSESKFSSKDISQQGNPRIIFDNGQEFNMKIHFQRVLRYILGNYVEISDIVNTPIEIAKESQEIFVNTTDELYIISPDRFWGIEFFMDEVLSSSSISVKYSQGGNVWSNSIDLVNNGFVDTTNGFRNKTGKMTWTDLPNWSSNDIIESTTVAYKGFMIKVEIITKSGICSVYEMKRISRIQGETGDFLTIKFSQLALSKKSEDDDVILTKSVTGDWRISFWYSNVPVTFLLDRCLAESNFLENKKSITSLKIVHTQARFNIWGKSPKYSYAKIMRAFDIEYFSEDDYVVWALIDNEIWKCSNTNIWEFVKELKMPNISYLGLDLLPEFRWYAMKIIKVDDELFCLFKYMNLINPGYKYYYCKYDYILDVVTDLIETDRYETRDGLEFVRNGYLGVDGSSNWYRRIGNYLGTNYGENVPIPYRQVIAAFGTGSRPTMYPAPDLTDRFTDSYPEWYFGGSFDNSGQYYNSKMGFYSFFNTVTWATSSPPAPTDFQLKFSFGQKGIFIENKSTGDLYMMIRHGLFPVYRWILTNLKDDTSTNHVYYDEMHTPQAQWYDTTNDILFMAYTLWRDDGNIISNSYITKSKIVGNKIINITRAWHRNAATAANTEITTDANNDNLFGTMPLIDEVDDAIYVGSSVRFNKVMFQTTTPSNTYEIEYWNGSTWTPVYDNYDHLFQNEFIATFVCPDDWELTGVGGSQDLFYIRFRVTNFVANTDLVYLRILETIIWHSADNLGEERWTPTWLEGNKDDNYLYGVFFNRIPTGDNPFQWNLFAIDITDAVPTIITNPTPVGFTIDNTQLYKDLIYNETDNSVYLIAENIRFKDRSSYLLRMKVESGTLKVYYCGTPISGEWGNINNLVCEQNSGSVFGITSGTQFKFWEYSKEYYQRIEIADLSSFVNIRNVIKELALFTNCLYLIHSERVMRFIKRTEYNGEIDLTWDENVLTEKPDFSRWEHHYDSVIVQYRSLIDSDITGDKKQGYDGWMKRIMSITSPLIQNDHIALVVSENLYDFYSKYRIHARDLKVIPLIQLEVIDKFNLFMPKNIIELDSDIDFIIIGISKTSDFNFVLEGLEKVRIESQDYGYGYGNS